jgi:hypothetical protein
MKIETRSHFTPVSITLESQKEIDRLFLFLEREARNELCVGDTYHLVSDIVRELEKHTSVGKL